MFCYKCGAQIDDQAVVCPKCGCPTKNYQQPSGSAYRRAGSSSSKSRLVALLLAIFLGGFGVHRFYLGKVGTGVVWLFTAGCFGIGWLIDIILIACGSMTDSTGRFVDRWEA